MNEETTATTPETAPEATAVPEYTIPGVTEVIPEETVPEVTEPGYEDLILTVQAVGSDIVHADLFGSFLLCGTLVGLLLLRGRYGT